MLDQLRQIAIFAKTIDHGSFRAAARDLRLSPSVVSHHISQLEDHLGVALIYRSTRKLALTPEGERLLTAAHDMLEAVDAGLSDLSSAVSEQTGELRLTIPSGLSQSRLTEALSRFAAAHPGITLDLTYTDMREELIADGLDLAIRMGLDLKLSATSRALMRRPRVLVAARDYLAQHPPVSRPEDLAQLDWIELKPIRHVRPTFRQDGRKPVALKTNGQITVNDVRALYHLARAGAGLAIVPDYLAEDDIAAGRVQHVLPDWQLDPVDVFAVWPANAPRHGLIRLLVDWLTQELAKAPDP